jgi:hypothetical protein
MERHNTLCPISNKKIMQPNKFVTHALEMSSLRSKAGVFVWWKCLVRFHT